MGIGSQSVTTHFLALFDLFVTQSASTGNSPDLSVWLSDSAPSVLAQLFCVIYKRAFSIDGQKFTLLSIIPLSYNFKSFCHGDDFDKLVWTKILLKSLLGTLYSGNTVYTSTYSSYLRRSMWPCFIRTGLERRRIRYLKR